MINNFPYLGNTGSSTTAVDALEDHIFNFFLIEWSSAFFLFFGPLLRVVNTVLREESGVSLVNSNVNSDRVHLGRVDGQALKDLIIISGISC